MSLWKKKRYYCTKLGWCRYPEFDIPYSAGDFRRFKGKCVGHKNDGCGSVLELGEPRDLRATWVLGGIPTITAALCAGWFVRTYVIPPPLEQIGFSAAEIQTADSAGLLELPVVRKSDLRRRVEVEYTSTDGSAKAGEDYQSVHDRLLFEPGEGAKSIRVMLVPDRSLRKEARYFTLTLMNVAGHPKELVQIAPRAVDRTEQLQAEQAVMGASRVAADIASYMVKRRVLLDLLTARAGSDVDAKTYRQQLLEVEENLDRAREGYSQSLRDLQSYQAPVVIHAIDRLHDDLESRHFAQQSRALQVMRSQFMELADKRSMDMDRWAQELESIVPRAGGDNNPESST
jgi:hypothetical protein